jgi:hypothetical protein
MFGGFDVNSMIGNVKAESAVQESCHYSLVHERKSAESHTI